MRKTSVGVPRPHHVAVAQPARPPDALLVHEGAVAGEAVVHDDPLSAHALELGLHSRDPGIPIQGDVTARTTADDRPLEGVSPQAHDALCIAAIAVLEKGPTRALSLLATHQVARAVRRLPQSAPSGQDTIHPRIYRVGAAGKRAFPLPMGTVMNIESPQPAGQALDERGGVASLTPDPPTVDPTLESAGPGSSRRATSSAATASRRWPAPAGWGSSTGPGPGARPRGRAEGDRPRARARPALPRAASCASRSPPRASSTRTSSRSTGPARTTAASSSPCATSRARACGT